MGKNQLELKIKNNIPILRSQHKITQEELAKAIGVTRATISSVEKGNYNPSLELAFKLARFFNENIDNVFQVEENHE